ncbi:MAG: hypothetical protein ACK416_03250, partial [Zestosphaera sp.]
MGSLHVLYLAGVATVQDLGRYGYRALGVPVSGALDVLSAAYANVLVGNKPNTALIELFGSIVLRAGEDTVVAVSGGLPKVFVGRYEVSSWRPIYLKSGTELVIRPSEIGSISY